MHHRQKNRHDALGGALMRNVPDLLKDPVSDVRPTHIDAIMPRAVANALLGDVHHLTQDRFHDAHGQIIDLLSFHRQLNTALPSLRPCLPPCLVSATDVHWPKRNQNPECAAKIIRVPFAGTLHSTKIGS